MPVTQSLNSKANVKKNTNQDLPFSPQQPVIASFYAVSTAGQTVINLSFSVDTINLTDQFFLFIDGKKLRLGSTNDYTFTSIGSTGLSSQVTLNSALVISLNIQAYMLGMKREVEFNTDNRFVQLYEAQLNGFQGFVNQANLITPTTSTGSPAAGTFYSTIVGRASMLDLSQNLRAQMGVERIMTQQMYPLQNEYGPNGEPVYGIQNDAFSQIRLIGPNWQNQIDAYGARLSPSTSFTESVEITFYGTGLNALMQLAFTGNAYTITVDGTAYSSGVLNAAYSAVSQARNYAFNTCVNLVTGLTLGMHTVTIKNTASGGAFHGFEILNESSSVKVAPGIGYVQGQKYTSAALQSFTYNSMATGTRGGRAVIYQKGDGTIGTSWQAVNAASATSTSADHTNEEVVRSYFPREFGSGRSDDFSLLAGTGRTASFTLDDGTTTLVAQTARLFNNGTSLIEGVGIDTNGQGITFTFVGTGLDIQVWDTAAGGSDTYNFQVDGGGTVAWPYTAGSASIRTLKIVSGLPYGTHTVRFNRVTAATFEVFISRFTVYQPKKPSIPSGSVELADYNVMATFVANTTQGLETLGTGTLLKASTREVAFVGAGWSAAQSVSHATGWRIGSSTNGDYLEYVFFGTGFELKTFTGGADSNSVQVALQNLTGGGSLVNLNTTNFPTLLGAQYGGTFSTSTGIANFSGASAQMGFSAYNLPLSLYKVRMTNGTSNLFQFSCINPIVPIHSSKSNIYGDVQNTLPVGSCSISDNRKLTPVKESLPSQKAWAQAVGVFSSPTTTSTSFVPMPDMSVNIKTNGGALKISFLGSGYANAANVSIYTRIYVDGQIVGTDQLSLVPTVGNAPVVQTAVVPVPAGTHKVDIFWAAAASTITIEALRRILTVEEK